jgi:septal ring factor EnvC (AmiA/AmiB activator)
MTSNTIPPEDENIEKLRQSVLAGILSGAIAATTLEKWMASEIERLRATQSDNEALKHDLARYIQISSDLATEIEQLRTTRPDREAIIESCAKAADSVGHIWEAHIKTIKAPSITDIAVAAAGISAAEVAAERVRALKHSAKGGDR